MYTYFLCIDRARMSHLRNIFAEKRMRRTRHSSSRAPTRPETPVIFEPEASTGTGPGLFQRWRNPNPTSSPIPTAT